MSASFQPWYTGQTYPTWDIPLNTDTGSDDITGVNIANFTMLFRNTNIGVDTVGTGTFSVKSTYPAEIYYKPSVADVSQAFVGSLVIKALFPPSNSTVDEAVYDPIPFTISPS